MNPNSYNEHPAATGDYTLKANPTLGLTVNNGTTSIYTNTILGIGDKYQIDLYGSMVSHKVEDFPLLSILYNMGTETAAPPYIVWNDEYTGTSWVDIGLDEMRLVDTANAVIGGLGENNAANYVTLTNSGYGAQIKNNHTPVAVDSASYVGGMYKFYTSSGALGSLAIDKTITDGNVSPKQNLTINGASTPVYVIALEDGANRGRVLNIYNRLRNLMYNFRYKETGTLS